MKSVEIIATGKYLPNRKVDNYELASMLNIDEEFILSRTGIKTRYYADDESVESMALKASIDLINKYKINKDEIEMIIVATTSLKELMPGISYKIQKDLQIKKCICMDVLAGCAGYINAFDIARLYVANGKCNNALIVGADKLFELVDKKDINTAVVLSDGAGATYIKSTLENKKYESNIVSDGLRGDILTLNVNEFINMNGKEIYKYAVRETVENINALLSISTESIDDIKYIIPHQANIRIIDSFTNKLNIENKKVYKNIETTGNTFCASIPIALNDMFDKNILNKKDKIILLGYGGGLNTGSILMEV